MFSLISQEFFIFIFSKISNPNGSWEAKGGVGSVIKQYFSLVYFCSSVFEYNCFSYVSIIFIMLFLNTPYYSRLVATQKSRLLKSR